MIEGSKKAVYTALFCNMGIAVFKITAALITRSSSMLAEGYHSISDTFNQVLLLIGLKRGRRKASSQHPFGYGKEQFFWSFVVAVILFGIAGTLSIREGVHKFQHPEPLSHLWLNFLVIAVAMFFETVAFKVALKKFKEDMRREKHKNWMEGLKRSKDPVVLTVLVEDTMALLGLTIAAIALALVQFTGLLVLDAIASILIGVMLMVFALFLANEIRKLLVGESVTPHKRKMILKVLRSYPEINRVISLKTMHLGSEEVLIAAELNYKDDLVTDEIEEINDRMEKEIKTIFPAAKIYLEAENIKSRNR